MFLCESHQVTAHLWSHQAVQTLTVSGCIFQPRWLEEGTISTHFLGPRFQMLEGFKLKVGSQPHRSEVDCGLDLMVMTPQPHAKSSLCRVCAMCEPNL